MCAPAIGLIGAAVSAAGSMASANAQAAQSRYNATVARINARTERQKGGVEQEKLEQKHDRLEGQSIAAAAKGGVDPGFGSAALAIFGENFEERAMDKNNAYINAESAAVANENKARDLEAQASAQKKAGAIGAASTFLGGLGGLAKSGGSALSING